MAYEEGVAAPPTRGSFGEFNSMQKPDVTNTLLCIIVPYLNAQKTQLRNLTNTNNYYTKHKVMKFEVGMAP